MTDGAIGAFFERVGPDSYQPTTHTGGGWDPAELHFSPLAGLIVHALELHLAAGGPRLLLGRISYDILGRLAADVCTVRVETARPGRTIELVEATLDIGGRAVIRARAWYLAAFDSRTVAGGLPAALAPPEDVARWPMSSVWPGGYVASLEVRPLGVPTAGRTTAWISTAVELVAGEKSSAAASFLALVDTANGIAVRQSPSEWMFPNVDLTVHLYRQPEGAWVGLDTTVIFGPTGQGVTETVLHDTLGPVGRAQQILTVRSLRPDPST